MKKTNKYDKTMKEIIKKCGMEENTLFITTIDRYFMQVQIMDDLKKSIEESGTLTTKEYVKGRENLYVNPAIREYNNTCNSANKTVSTLMNMVKDSVAKETTKDELLDFLSE